MKTIAKTWKAELTSPRFRVEFVASVAILLVTLSMFAKFLGWVEQRDGVVLSDPVLNLFEARDFTWMTFGLIYLAIILAIVNLSSTPKALLIAVQTYTVMVLVRTVMMFLVPLAPPIGAIVLQDPFVQYFGSGEAPTKDLFFSGHTSTMFILSLVSTEKRMKMFFLALTVLVGTCVIWQHVHYVIDVAVAPFVAYGSYSLVKNLSRW